jgi:hypothetical protein
MSTLTPKFIRFAVLGAALASTIGAVAIAAAAPASAADIYDRRTGAAYDDPRYADIYTYPEPARPVGPPRREYLAPMPPHYFDGPRRHAGPPNNCASHHDIRRDLNEQGWSEFNDVELRGSTALIEARRPNGNLYQLKIDRCSGEILNAQRLGDGRRPYASRERDGGRPY